MWHREEDGTLGEIENMMRKKSGQHFSQTNLSTFQSFKLAINMKKSNETGGNCVKSIYFYVNTGVIGKKSIFL